jgi:hypothetical protein
MAEPIGPASPSSTYSAARYPCLVRRCARRHRPPLRRPIAGRTLATFKNLAERAA